MVTEIMRKTRPDLASSEIKTSKETYTQFSSFMISNNIDPQRFSPFVHVQFRKFKMNALVDTPVDKSVMSEKNFQSLEKKIF